MVRGQQYGCYLPSPQTIHPAPQAYLASPAIATGTGPPLPCPPTDRPPSSPATVTGTGPLPLPISIRPCRPPSLRAIVTGTGTLWRTAGHRVQCSSACLSSARWITSWTRRGEEARSSPSCTWTVVKKFGVCGGRRLRGVPDPDSQQLDDTSLIQAPACPLLDPLNAHISHMYGPPFHQACRRRGPHAASQVLTHFSLHRCGTSEMLPPLSKALWTVRPGSHSSSV